ncbi:MAG TPA: hypothetical protein VNH19_17830, partial [Candidatus Limnocylindrales bacterium]|nr:hypothetical protein [Candidatus Limnocylindrales bacterium]
RWILDETFLNRSGTSYTPAGHKSKAILKTGIKRGQRGGRRVFNFEGPGSTLSNHLDDKQFECLDWGNARTKERFEFLPTDQRYFDMKSLREEDHKGA